MPKKDQPQQVYKTETQLKEEARAKQASELEAAANVHKTEFQIKRENYWYHYKWHTIAGLIAAFLLIFFIKDMFFRTKPDTTIVVVSGGYISTDALESLSAALEEYATDFNGDGKVVIETDSISLPGFGSGDERDDTAIPNLTGGEQDMGNAMKLMAVVAAGAEPIYLLDESSYEYLTAMGQGEDSSADNGVFEEFRVPANSENIVHEHAAEFEGMTFYLRSNFNDESYYEYCMQLLQAIAGD